MTSDTERKVYALHLRTACGATRVVDHHETPRRLVVPLNFRHRTFFRSGAQEPLRPDEKFESRRFELDRLIYGDRGEVVGGEYVEIEG